MFTLDGDKLFVSLPAGKTQQELINIGVAEINTLVNSRQLDGLDLIIDGAITTGVALMLGHKLAHIAKSVSINVPREKAVAIAITH